MLAIFRKELWSYFGNWSAWIIIAAFSTVSALFLFFFENDFNLLDIGSASLHSFFVLAPWLFLFIIPALTMKTFAEEQQNGTLQWLFSQPLKISEIVLGKFFAVFIIVTLCLLPSLVYLYSVYIMGVPEGNLDFGATLGSYFGLMVLTAAFTAVGVMASSLSSNQIMAFLIGVFLNFIFYFGIEQLANFKLLGGADYLLKNAGFYHHFMAFTRGLIDTKDVFYFLLVIALSLGTAKHFIEKKK